jgi:hypothetical protein
MKETMPAEMHAELVAIVGEWRETVKLLDRDGKSHLLPASDRFNYVITIDDMAEDELADNPKTLKGLLPDLPYVKQGLKERLKNIIGTVPQIKATCLTPWGLSKALDLLLFNITETSQLGQLLQPDDEFAAQYLSQKFFEEPFTRIALVHLYNLKTDQTEIKLDEINARILTLTESDLPLVTGESTFTSSLHYTHTGNCFLVFENTDTEEPRDWLSSKWDETWKFISVLKYLKNEVVDIDYAGRFYRPTWANKVIRYGVDIMGRPRWDEQSTAYHVSDEMLPKLHQWIQAKLSLDPILSDVSSDLGRIIDLAAGRYLIHHTKNSLVEQLLDLTIALEALFSPSDQIELRFRISQSLALLLGKDGKDRKEIFDFAKKMYDERSGFVHGGRDPVASNKVTAAEIQRLGDLVRQAILRLGTLFARGERSRKSIHDEIALAAFDSAKSEQLRNQSDLEIFLEETFPIAKVSR